MINVNRKSTSTPKDGLRKSHSKTYTYLTNIEGWKLNTYQNCWRPPTDIIETEANITVRVEVAGMNESDFSITIEDSLLTISGARFDPGSTGAFHQMEIHTGHFYTAVDLVVKIDTHDIVANYQDGFLTVILNKISPYNK